MSSNGSFSCIRRKMCIISTTTSIWICSSLKASSRICQSFHVKRRGWSNIKRHRRSFSSVFTHSSARYVDAVAAAVSALFNGSDFCPYKEGYRKNDFLNDGSRKNSSHSPNSKLPKTLILALWSWRRVTAWSLRVNSVSTLSQISLYSHLFNDLLCDSQW